MSVVVATTLQDHPVARARFACRLTGQSEVLLLHLVEDDVDVSALQRAQQDLAAFVAELAGHGLHATSSLGTATAWSDRVERVLDAASQPGVALVALGTPPERIGSIVARVTVRSPVPVLVGGGEVTQPPRLAHVAVGLDGSATSLRAARWARTVPDARVVALHAAQGGEAGAKARLEARLAEEPALAGLDVWVRAIGGTADEEGRLQALADEAGADVLVVGVHQDTNPDRLVGGSVLVPLLTGSRRPVLAVPDAPHEAGLPRLRRVLVPVAFQPSSEAAVPWAFSMVGRDGYVVLAHATSPMEVEEARVLERARHIEARLMGLIPDAATGTRCACRTLFQYDPVAAVLAEADRMAADAIVIGAEPHSPLYGFVIGSFVQDLLAKSPRPVFIIR